MRNLKTIEEILRQTPVFLEIFTCEKDVFTQFDKMQEEERVLFAYYDYENYSGHSYVMYEKNGKLYETHGSHCSCYGLEGQFSEEEVCLPQLLKTCSVERDEWDRQEYHKELLKFITKE